MAMLELRQIQVRRGLGDTVVLEIPQLRVEPGELLMVVGANGSGKSTLLRLVAGLLDAEQISGEVLVRTGARVGLVGQDPASQLVASTVARDVAWALELQSVPSETITARVTSALERAGLRAQAWRRPQELSGGQQQRTALAGALAAQCELLLMDEPTSQLDAAGRSELRAAARMARAGGQTLLWVTQIADDLALASRVLALESGQVVYDGPAAELAWLLAADSGLARRLGVEAPAAARLGLALGFGHDDPGQAPGAEVPLTVDELAARLGVAL